MTGFESVVEQAAIEWFQALGYDYVAGPTLAPDGEAPERADYTTPLLEGRFRAALATTPLAFLQQARIAAARELLRSSNLAIADIAARCGYGNASHFSRAFSAHTGTAPQSYRRRVRGKLFTSATGPVGTN